MKCRHYIDDMKVHGTYKHSKLSINFLRFCVEFNPDFSVKQDEEIFSTKSKNYKVFVIASMFQEK